MTTLAGVLPETRAAFDALDAYARSQGIGISVADFGGLRTSADTTRILKYRDDDYAVARRAGTIRPDTTLAQFRPIAPFGHSYHNYGAAFDIIVTARPSSLSVAGVQRKLGEYAPRIGLRWGGTFSNPDAPHFELAISLAEAQARYRNAPPPSSLLDSFDLSAFLPGLTPTEDPTPPDVSGPAADDSGEAIFSEHPAEPSNAGLVALGLFVAGMMAWALRRKYF